MKKHFDNLGLPQTATQADVKRAYRKLAMTLHPDKNSHPEAANLFAELQESYDLLMDYLDTSQSKTQSSKSTIRKEKTKDDRIKEARKRYEEQKLREKKANEQYFNKLTKGLNWKIYKTGSLVCAVVFCFLLLDSLLPKFKEQDQITGLSNSEKGGIALGFVHPIFLEKNGVFQIERGIYHDFKTFPTVYVTKTRLLRIPVEIVHPVEAELKIHAIDWCFWIFMPFALMFFAFPSLLFVYRKQSPNFVFSYLLSLYVIFPLTVLFLLSDNRWLHLLTVGIF